MTNPYSSSYAPPETQTFRHRHAGSASASPQRASGTRPGAPSGPTANTFSAKYPHANRCVARLEECLENEPTTFDAADFEQFERQSAVCMKEASEALAALEHLVKYDSSSQRAVSRAKLGRLKHQEANARRAIERSLDRHRQREREKRQRENLLDPSRARRKEKMNQLLSQQESLKRSNNMVSDMLQMSHDVLNDMTRQRRLLDKASRTMATLGRTLGLSNDLIRMISRREFVDRLLVFGGMFCLTMLLLILWWFYG